MRNLKVAKDIAFISLVIIFSFISAVGADNPDSNDGDRQRIEGTDSSEMLIIEDAYDTEEVLIIEDAGDSELSIFEETGDSEEILIIEDAGDSELSIIEETGDSEEILIIEDAGDSELSITEETSDTLGSEEADSKEMEQVADNSTDHFSAKIDELRAEYGLFPDSDSAADHQGYLHSKATLNWSPNSTWEYQLSGRVDGYYQWGDLHSEDLDLDYEESFVRYNDENVRITIGTQKIIWGRIDEFPPSDRLSTQDISRFVLDDLSRRRRASPAIRLEYFNNNARLDLMALPFFREAELAEKDSVWFPVNRQSGEIIGLESTQASREIVKNTSISLDEPDSEGGFGLRFSNSASQFDYAVTVQRGRQTLPYFSYDASKDIIESRYPRTWVAGGDIAFEALSGTLRFEATWLNDTPVTQVDGNYTTVNSVSWGGAFEFFPGDSDARLNLQITGTNLIDAGSVLDRSEVYSFNGTYDVPFANDSWRFKVRFYTGLNEHDVYINPEIAYKPRPSQEAYLAAHYFDGSNGTPGGFHENNSVITLGWRGYF
jgi:hypothetical protein